MNMLKEIIVKIGYISYYPMQFKGKITNQTWENAKKLISVLILAQI